MSNKNKIRTVSAQDDVISTLVASGYSASEVEELIRTFDEDTDKMSDLDFLTSSKHLEMAHSLSKEWIVKKLKSLVEGSDPMVAVMALKVLAGLSEKR